MQWFQNHRLRSQQQRLIYGEIIDTLKNLVNTESGLESFTEVNGAIEQMIRTFPSPCERLATMLLVMSLGTKLSCAHHLLAISVQVKN